MEGPTEEILEGHGLSFINSDIFFTLTLAKSPINIHELEAGLVDYNNIDKAEILQSFKYGFKLHYSGPREPTKRQRK